MNDTCCNNPKRVGAPVDCVFAAIGIRLRHLPGNICLSCRDIVVPDLTPSSELIQSIHSCLQGDPSHLCILKAVPDSSLHPAENDYLPAQLDIGIGENAGLVVTHLSGRWNAHTREALLPDDGQELRERLSCLENQTDGRLVPSLLYDTPDHPRSIQIELTTRCNLTCSYCTHRDIPVKADIPMDKLMHLLDRIDFTQVENVDFTGLGEPILHPQLPEVIREVRRRGSPADIRVVTNGTVLTPGRARAICEAGITSIAFSLDSVNPVRFAQTRGGAKLDKVMGNLRALVAYRETQQLSALQIKIKAVLIDNPYEEAKGLMELSASLQLDMPHFSCLDRRDAVQEHYQADWSQDEFSKGGSPAFLTWAENTWKELGGRGMRTASLPADAVFINPLITPPPSLCRWAIDAAYISASGDMLSCCEQMIDLPRRNRGSLLTKDLRNLWQDDLLWSYRLPLSVGIAADGCEGCAWAPVSNLTAVPA
jgi:sulfatase maturation enzyme AslB (radical SAM superfamily)